MRVYTKKQLTTALKRENEIWLYSYADLITNLMAFFLLLLTISQASPAMRERVQESLGKAMGTARPNDAAVFANTVTQMIDSQNLQNKIAVKKTLEGTSLIFSGGLFFESLSANLTTEAQQMLDQVIPLLSKLPTKFRFDIEGHADSRPVQNVVAFASNWELSAARAGAVVRYLSQKGLSSRKFRAIGYADSKPISQEDRENRRVVITVARGLEP